MKQERRNIPDFDDLVFESRNKDYGAYKLRKDYKWILAVSTIISVFIACCLTIIPFYIEKSSNKVTAVGARYVPVEMDDFIPPREEYNLPTPPPPSSGQMQEIKYVPPEVVDTIIPTSSTMVTADEALAHAGDTTVVGNASGIGEDLTSGEGGSDLGEAFLIVEEMPRFMGGDINKFRQWVMRRAIYPEEAIDNNIKGTVVVTFIVEKDGSVTNVKVVKGVHPLLDEEAIKVISSSPRWSPGLQRGQAVRVRYSIALIF
jgi:periplasmic protein TonB